MYIQSQFLDSVMETVKPRSLNQKFWENPANCQLKNWVQYWKHSLHLGDYNAAVSNCKIEITWLQKNISERCYHVLFDKGTGRFRKCSHNKNNSLRPFDPKVPLVILREMNTVRANWDFVFWQTLKAFIKKKFCKKSFIGGVAVKPMQIDFEFRFSAMTKQKTLVFPPIWLQKLFLKKEISSFGLVDENLIGSQGHYKTYFGQSLKRKFLSFERQICSKFILCSLFGSVCFWLTVQTKLIITVKLNFSYKLSPYQRNLLHLKKFSGQPAGLSREFVPTHWFSQTRCLGLLISSLYRYSRFSRWKKANDSSLYGWLNFLSVVGISFHCLSM